MINSRGRIPAIDGLRGIAAIFIACFYHLATVPFPYQNGLPLNLLRPLGWLYKQGGVFVELFFVLSGYTSFVAYANKIDDGLSLGRYSARRAIRIYPLMLATLAIAAAGNVVWYLQHGRTWWIGVDANNNLTTLIFSCLGLQMFYPGPQSWNYPAWSLSVFFVCWLIFWIMLWATRKTPERRVLICLALILLGIGLEYNPLPTQVAFFNSHMARGYIAFFAGGGYLLFTELYGKRPKEKRSGGGLCFANISRFPYSWRVHWLPHDHIWRRSFSLRVAVDAASEGIGENTIPSTACLSW